MKGTLSKTSKLPAISKSKKTTAIININNGKCSPDANKNYEQYHSCFAPSDITSLAHMYNSFVSSAEQIPKEQFDNPKTLYSALRARIKPCENKHEACLLHQDFVKSRNNDMFHALIKRFRPRMPATWKTNTREWLNTYNIIHVMKQYENAYSAFEFLGVFPVNFNTRENGNVCIEKKMCQFTLADFLQTGKREFGMVVNLDRHDQPGSHWVALYCAFERNGRFGMVYFDSGGQKPPKLIKTFMKEVYVEAERLFFNVEDFKSHFKAFYNQTEYQKKNTECGMFSMVFLVACIENKTDDLHYVKNQFNTHKVMDDKVHKLRSYLYSNYDAPVIDGNSVAHV